MTLITLQLEVGRYLLFPIQIPVANRMPWLFHFLDFQIIVTVNIQFYKI